MRLVVTGRDGQVARALAEAGPAHGVEVVRLGRPELDLAWLETVAPALRAARPDVVVSAAAYTAVDRAETEPELAHAVNAAGAGSVAEAAAALGVPVLHLSTDYVFDGAKPSPYVETDPVGPLNVYGASKLGGERAVAAAGGRHAILRVSWLFGPHGANFVRSMLRLAPRGHLRVVADQHGAPTYAPDVAEALLALAPRLVEGRGATGLFHLSAAGATSWAGFAEAVFQARERWGEPPVTVEPIGTAEYGAPARRPLNSRLDTGLLRGAHGIALPDWQDGLARCLAAMRPADAPAGWVP